MFYTILSSYFLMKHSQKLKQEKQNKKKADSFPRINPIPKVVKNGVCRICLKHGTRPIYEHNSHNIADTIRLFGGIELLESDDFPKYMCDSCHDLLRSAMQFRKIAKQSDQILRKKKNLFEIKKSKEKQRLLKKSKVEPKKIQIKSNQLIGKLKSEDVDNQQVNFELDEDSYFENNQSDSDQLSSIGFPSDIDFQEITRRPPTPIEQYYSPIVSDSDFNGNAGSSKRPILKKKLRVKCKICSRIVFKTSYKTHYIRHKPPDTKSLLCDICGKSFHQRNVFRCHYESHSSEFRYKCSNCNYKSNSSTNLRFHMRVHKNEFRYMCTMCPKRFRYNSNMHKHMLKHKEPAFSCDYCKKSYYTKPYLERHIQGEHFGRKEYKCHFCGGDFSHRKSWKYHMIRIHKQKKSDIRGRIPAYLEKELRKQRGMEAY